MLDLERRGFRKIQQPFEITQAVDVRRNWRGRQDERPGDGDILRQAVQATFDRRKTTLTGQAPFGLTDAFAQDAQKQTQWQAFLKKNRLEALTLSEVITAVDTFMLPVIVAASANTAFPSHWQAGGPWTPADNTG